MEMIWYWTLKNLKCSTRKVTDSLQRSDRPKGQLNNWTWKGATLVNHKKRNYILSAAQLLSYNSVMLFKRSSVRYSRLCVYVNIFAEIFGKVDEILRITNVFIRKMPGSSYHKILLLREDSLKFETPLITVARISWLWNFGSIHTKKQTKVTNFHGKHSFAKTELGRSCSW